MNRHKTASILALTLSMILATPVFAVDSIFLAVGRGHGSTTSKIYQWGVLWNWTRQWFKDGNWYLGGYHEVSAGYIDSDFDGDVIEGGYTAMFRVTSHNPLVIGVAPYIDAGIGIHAISDTKIGNKDISTFLQFSPNGGAGLRFGRDQRFEIGYRFWHLSNANIGETNPGLNYHLARLTYHF